MLTVKYSEFFLFQVQIPPPWLSVPWNQHNNSNTEGSPALFFPANPFFRLSDANGYPFNSGGAGRLTAFLPSISGDLGLTFTVQRPGRTMCDSVSVSVRPDIYISRWTWPTHSPRSSARFEPVELDCARLHQLVQSKGEPLAASSSSPPSVCSSTGIKSSCSNYGALIHSQFPSVQIFN